MAKWSLWQLGTVSLPAVPNWLQSPLKPRAQLCMEVVTNHGDQRPRIDKMRIRWARSKADSVCDVELSSNVRLANSKARIKPTAPLLAFDKENSMEFLLDFLYYLYNYYMVCALLSHTYHVTCHVTVTMWHFPTLPSV